jgi:hypothetical protein
MGDTRMARPRGGAAAVVVARWLAWTEETLGQCDGGGSESPSMLDHDEGHRDGQAAQWRRCSRVGAMARVGLETLGGWGDGV